MSCLKRKSLQTDLPSSYDDDDDDDDFKLLERLNQFKNSATYHLDATYKIVKYCYPLIVFGLTDIMRQFIPVAFMFTSHETTDDYNYFFESLKIVCERLEIDLSPEFFALDASKAMANAVKLHFPKAKILMCFFHSQT